MGTLTNHSKRQPESIQKLIEKIVKELKPQKIILFGSRARGDHRENSDFDIACVFTHKDPKKWTEFLVNLQEETLTLWPVDMLDYSELSEEYKKNIQREGVNLYE